jgi:hypothetical protein
MSKKKQQPDDESEPQVYDVKRLRNEIALAREFVMTAEYVRRRIKELQFTSITVMPGKGAGAFTRAKQHLKAWGRGLKSALEEQIETEGVPEVDDDASAVTVGNGLSDQAPTNNDLGVPTVTEMPEVEDE